MTTEQMDWLDDERAGRHAPKVLRGHPTEEEIAEARKDAPFGVLIVPTEELGPYFDAEEHTHHSNWARRVCAAGDHEGALAFDGEVEREKIRAETTMAEEPIEQRLRRAWLNGYTDGYSEGFNRASYPEGSWS